MKYIIPFLHNIKLTVLILISIIVFILIKLFLKIDYKSKRHKRKIITADKIILKLNGFTGVYKNQQILAYLRKIDPYVFEELLLSAFAMKGFKIIRNKSYSGDGGIDGMIINNECLFLIQAKRYSSFVKREHIKDFELLITEKNAVGGYFIHTGRTAVKSHLEYKNSSIQIISGQKLIDLILN